MKVEKILNCALMVFLALLLAASLLKLNFKSGVISQAENRYLASFPQLLDGDGFNKDFGGQFKSWFSDNLGYRDDYIRMSSNLQYRLLHKSPSDKVEIGRDGWLFYTLDNNLDIAKGEYPNFDEAVLAEICAQQIKIQTKLKEQGIEYVLVLPVSKVSIYPEFIMSGEYSVRKTPADILADYMEEHSDIKVIRLKEALLDAKNNGEQVFFKYDTHWNEYGAYIAYVEIAKKLNEWGISGIGPATVSFSDGTHAGEFSSMMGDPDLLPLESCKRISVPNPQAERLESGERFDTIQNLVHSLGISTSWYTYQNVKTDEPKALMYGDSLFGHFSDWSMTELMAQNFSEFTFIWDGNIQQAMIDAVHPDVVIYELGERFLNTLPSRNMSFLTDRFENYSAKITGYEIDGSSLKVRVRNTGAEKWERTNYIRMCLWVNDQDSGRRAMLPLEEEVAPGELYTFVFDEIDKEFFSKNSVQAMMLQEGICYFGDRCPINSEGDAFQVNDAEILLHDTPQEVTHDGSYEIHISVKNTGTTVWSEETNYRLCIYQNGVDWGFRIWLPDGVTVSPGEQYTFVLQSFVLPEAEETYLEYQMVQENVEFFGGRERADIKAVG